MLNTIMIHEPVSRLHARASLLGEKAPAIVSMITAWLSRPRITPAIHAMWTGPEISSQIDIAELDPAIRETSPPVQNATIYPLAGELVFLRIPERAWDGAPNPIFDIGLFYGDRARLLFPIGWLPGSVFARVVPEDRDPLAAACTIIRSAGRTRLEWALV